MAIPLTQGLYALVDGKDYEWLAQYNWHAAKDRNTFYAYRCIRTLEGKQKRKPMHQDILGRVPNLETDHINHNGLDNRRVNLRLVTTAENQQNQRPKRGYTSKYKGVFRWKDKWQALIRHNKKRFYLGQFKTEIEAANAYVRKRKELCAEEGRRLIQWKLVV